VLRKIVKCCNNCYILSPMQKHAAPNNRWFKDQMEAKGFSQNQLGKRLGMDPAAISRVLNGQRKLKIEEATQMAEILELPLEEVLANAGIGKVKITGKERKEALSIGGWVDGDLALHAGAPLGPKSAPNPAPGQKGIEVYRFQTQGSAFDGMDGGLVYFQRMKGVMPECVGRLCVVKISGSRKKELLRTIRRGYEPGKFNLYLLNGAIAEESAQLDDASPVLWLKM
jgi:transcriptional regulator with XRE-family HTH domain